MGTVNFATVPSKRLATSINAAAMSFQVNNITGWDGVALTSAFFGAQAYVVFRSDTNNAMEIMEIDPTTIASASITILKRGLGFNGDLTTQDSAKMLTWVKNTTIVEFGTDVPQLLNHTVRDAGTQTIADKKTFSTIPASTDTPTSSTDLATKAYVDAQVGGTITFDQQTIAGTSGAAATAGNVVYFKESDQRWYPAKADAAATATGVKLGVIQTSPSGAGIATTILIAGRDKKQSALTLGQKYYLSASVAGALVTTPGTFARFIGTAVSATDLLFEATDDSFLLHQSTDAYAADSGSANAYVVTLGQTPSAYVTGIIVSFKATTRNSGVSTLNVNGLGVKTIKKDVTQDLASGDIESGQIVTVVYDGTNFQMLNGRGAVPTGGMLAFAGTSAPAGYLLCDGSAVSRTTYAALFAVMSTVYGVGDGSTTFNVPDTRSRTIVGKGTGLYATTFVAANITVANPGVITLASTAALFTGMPLTLSNPGAVPTGFVNSTVYYVIIVDSTHIQLASTMANAIAGTGIQCTGQGSGTNTLTLNLTARNLGDLGGEESHADNANEMPVHAHGAFNSGGSTGILGDANPQTGTSTTSGNAGGSQAHNNMPPYAVATYIVKI